MIVCPACGSPTGVRETRDGPDSNYVRRRRICTRVECGHRVTTFEVVVPDPVAVPDPVIVSRKAIAALALALEPPKPDED